MSLVVTGTDTGVGKTVVTAALVARLRERGTDARAIKPVQTGYPDDDDAGFVRWACGGDPGAADRLRTFEEPLAPAVAARRADERIEYRSLLADVRAAIDDVDVGVVEGAGGLRVPLATDDESEIVDLVAALEHPVLVVARSGLGTLNHTALTVEALERRGCQVVGIVLNRYEADSAAARTNPGELERMCDMPVSKLPERSLEAPEDVRELADDLPARHRQMGDGGPL